MDRSPDFSPPLLTVRVWVSLGLLAFALAVLTITPGLVSHRTRTLRLEITEIAEPTIAAASGVERAVALQLAALRGYALTGDSTHLARYRRMDVEEREATRRLSELGQDLGPEVVGHVGRLEALAAEWDARVDAALSASGGQDAERLVTRGEFPEVLLSEARSLRRSGEAVQRLRRADIAAVERLEIWTTLAMVILAAAGVVSLVVIGRKLHALRLEAETRRQELQRSHDRRARMIRGISHDLKNPLGAAQSHAEFLEMEIKGPVNQAQRESLAAIRRSVGATVRLIEDLLHLARAERGELPLNPTDVDFSALVAEIAAEARMQAEEKNVVLDLEASDTPVRGRTDADRVREVLQNLVSNAIRYTPAGGRVALRVSERIDPARSPRRAVRMCVADTGPGIASADHERVFQEFERAANDGGGSGLGLAISRHIAQLLGGDIELESELGKGSVFCLTLPGDPHEISQGRSGAARAG